MEGEREGEKHDVQEKQRSVAPLMPPNWGPGLQPRHVPSPGIELATFWSTGQCSVH